MNKSEKKFIFWGSTDGVAVSSEAKRLSDLNMLEQVFRGSLMRGSLTRGSLMRGTLLGNYLGEHFGEGTSRRNFLEKVSLHRVDGKREENREKTVNYAK
jgi:hypothetical protein